MNSTNDPLIVAMQKLKEKIAILDNSQEHQVSLSLTLKTDGALIKLERVDKSRILITREELMQICILVNMEAKF